MGVYMDYVELIAKISEYNLSIRRIPDKIVSCYEIRHMEEGDKTDTFKPFINITKEGEGSTGFRSNNGSGVYYYESLFSCPDCGVVQTLIVREPDYNDDKLLDNLERTVR